MVAKELKGFFRETQMREASMRGVLAGKLVEMTAVKDRVHCREVRQRPSLLGPSGRGFMQEKIYPLFGYYPWRCKICRVHVMLRKRKRAPTKK